LVRLDRVMEGADVEAELAGEVHHLRHLVGAITVVLNVDVPPQHLGEGLETQVARRLIALMVLVPLVPAAAVLLGLNEGASVPGAAYTPRCEWSSIKPGVTYLPVPSTTTASAGACTVAPTATMRPSLNRIEPLAISCPAAVRIVALRISTGGLG